MTRTFYISEEVTRDLTRMDCLIELLNASPSNSGTKRSALTAGLPMPAAKVAATADTRAARAAKRSATKERQMEGPDPRSLRAPAGPVETFKETEASAEQSLREHDSRVALSALVSNAIAVVGTKNDTELIASDFQKLHPAKDGRASTRFERLWANQGDVLSAMSAMEKIIGSTVVGTKNHDDARVAKAALNRGRGSAPGPIVECHETYRAGWMVDCEETLVALREIKAVLAPVFAFEATSTETHVAGQRAARIVLNMGLKAGLNHVAGQANPSGRPQYCIDFAPVTEGTREFIKIVEHIAAQAGMTGKEGQIEFLEDDVDVAMIDPRLVFYFVDKLMRETEKAMASLVYDRNVLKSRDVIMPVFTYCTFRVI